MVICTNRYRPQVLASRRTWRHAYAATFALALAASGIYAQPLELSLQQAGSRAGPDSAPAYEGKEVRVRGRVSALAGWAVDTWYLPIQDEASYGLVIAAERAQLSGFRPGDSITATGVIS